MVLKGLEEGVFERESDGSVWADLSAENLDRKILLRADGTSVYITQDIGTAQLKYDDYQMDRSIYVVGNEQEYHFKVLKSLLQKLKKPHAEGVFHLSYGMVDLPSGKMKSREGTVVDADDLMDEMVSFAAERTAELGKTEGLSLEQLAELHHNIGLGALKFFLLKVDAKKKMLFNPEESIDFNGFTGPFIQYTFARISSILRKADQVDKVDDSIEMSEYEVGLIKTLELYPNRLNDAADQLNPAILAQYIYSLAKSFNRFYHEHSILNEANKHQRNLRLAITSMTGKVLGQGLTHLGIQPTEQM
jgi:arginyl-tRNA synthetase